MGTADITRDQFNAAKNVVRKIAQRNVYIVDADFNEQGQISDYRLTELAYLMAQGRSVRFGTGWVITGGSNQISITAGKALVQLATSQSYILNQTSSPLNVTGWTTPSGGNRTDILYADISLPIIDVGDDPTIVNPTVGIEACVDQRLTYTLVKLQGTVGGGVPTIPTAPAGHYYVAICQIARTSGQATIADSSITNLLDLWETPNVVYMQSLIDLNASGGLTEWGPDVGDPYNIVGCLTSSGPSAGTYYKKLQFAFAKRPLSRKLIIMFQAKKAVDGMTDYVRCTVEGLTAQTFAPPSTSNTWGLATLTFDISSLANFSMYTVILELKAVATNYGTAVRKIVAFTTT